MFYTTASRRPSGASFKDSASLWPMNFQGEGWGGKVSALHVRAIDILRNDPTVTAVTVLEW